MAFLQGERKGQENLKTDLVRRIMWSPPTPVETATIAEVLRTGGAREWQIELTLDLLTDAAARA